MRSGSRRSSSRFVSFGLSLLLLVGFNPTSPAFQYQEVHDWIPVFGIQYKVGVDGLSIAPRGPDHDPQLDQHPGLVPADQGTAQGIHDLVPDPRGRPDRRLRGPRPLPVLHLLGGRPRPDVPDHRDLGRLEPDLRDDQVRPVHPRRLAADARRDPGHRVQLPERDRLVGGRLRLRQPAALRGDDRLRQQPPDLRVPGVLPGLRDQGPDVPVPHLAARRPRRGADGRLGDAGGDPAQARRLRLHPLRACPSSRPRPRPSGRRSSCSA